MEKERFKKFVAILLALAMVLSQSQALAASLYSQLKSKTPKTQFNAINTIIKTEPKAKFIKDPNINNLSIRNTLKKITVSKRADADTRKAASKALLRVSGRKPKERAKFITKYAKYLKKRHARGAWYQQRYKKGSKAHTKATSMRNNANDALRNLLLNLEKMKDKGNQRAVLNIVVEMLKSSDQAVRKDAGLLLADLLKAGSKTVIPYLMERIQGMPFGKGAYVIASKRYGRINIIQAASTALAKNRKAALGWLNAQSGETVPVPGKVKWKPATNLGLLLYNLREGDRNRRIMAAMVFGLLHISCIINIYEELGGKKTKGVSKTVRDALKQAIANETGPVNRIATLALSMKKEHPEYVLGPDGKKIPDPLSRWGYRVRRVPGWGPTDKAKAAGKLVAALSGPPGKLSPRFKPSRIKSKPVSRPTTIKPVNLQSGTKPEGQPPAGTGHFPGQDTGDR